MAEIALSHNPSAINPKVGDRFGQLVIVDAFPERIVVWGGRRHRRKLWKCLCDCGKETVVPDTNFRRKKNSTRSCGCARNKPSLMRRGKDLTAKVHMPEYKIWAGAISRCENEGNSVYYRYGGRGIKVCPRWRGSFEAFFEDMGERPTKRHSIERVDNDGDYEPGNCRWATQKEQSRNRSSNRIVTLRGRRMVLTDACAELGISATTFAHRIQFGYSEKEALTPPWQRKRKRAC